VYYGQKKLEAALGETNPVAALNAAFVEDRTGEATAIPAHLKDHRKG
jgi:hypothetical protein